MNVAIIGAGAVGLGLASCLAPYCDALTLVVRRDRAAQTIRRGGLERRGLFGERHVDPSALDVATTTSALAARRLDDILVCSKTIEAEKIAEDLARIWPTFDSPPRVVVCHNGWGSAQILAARLPAEQVFSARVITGFRRIGDATVEITVHAQPIHMGGLFGQDASVLAPLCAAIEAGGIPCEPTHEIERDLLAKLLYNCLLNPLGALARVPYGVLGERKETREIMARVAHEIFAVLAASGHHTHWDSADAYLETFHAQLLPPTAEHESSMLQDLRAGRATEIDALCGAVVALGNEHGVETPVNAALVALIRAAESARS